MRGVKGKRSPFLFGKTVVENSFINRTKDIEHLWLNMQSGINTVLISPRRWGKSSLVKHTSIIYAKEENVRWCFLDMFAIRNEADFYAKLTTELLKVTSSKWKNWVETTKSFFKQIVPQINMGIDPVNDFSVSFRWEDLTKNKDEILDFPEKIAQKFNIQLIVCIDEFQNINSFDSSDAFEKLLRSHWQHHQHVSYCLYGSKRTLMTEIFNKKNRAFYRFGDVIMLNKIATEHWTPFIVKKFSETGKIISENLSKKIVENMKNHTYYVQQLSHYVWENTDNEATDAILTTALDRLLEINTPFYQAETEHLNNTQIELLKAIVNGEKQLTAVKTLRSYRIGTPQNVIKNIKSLEKQDFIDKQNGVIELLDPAFEFWLKRIL
ncbi:MAG: ATP-binding protein [Prevotellaceae bacterium]|nr:ATP-binding protein [Prevotellaceae bacterium]